MRGGEKYPQCRTRAPSPAASRCCFLADRVPNRGSRGGTARASGRDAQTRDRGSRWDVWSLIPRYSRFGGGCTHLDLSPSRSSTASWMPVEAPEGVMARNMPLWVWTSASTVGLPRESKIWRATTLVMAAGVCFLRYSACVGSRGGKPEQSGTRSFFGTRRKEQNKRRSEHGTATGRRGEPWRRRRRAERACDERSAKREIAPRRPSGRSSPRSAGPCPSSGHLSIRGPLIVAFRSGGGFRRDSP